MSESKTPWCDSESDLLDVISSVMTDDLKSAREEVVPDLQEVSIRADPGAFEFTSWKIRVCERMPPYEQ